VLSGRLTEHGFALEVGGKEGMTLACRTLVNSGGVHAPRLARAIAGIPAASIPRDYFCRGVYFTLSGRSPFRHLVYPVPEAAGLGVHLTLDLGGQAKFGPDVEWIDGIDYTVDPRRGERFYAVIRRYWPGLPDGALQPGYAGIRPKISGPAAPAADFLIQGPAEHGVPGLVNLYGIESPGLTASLAIAEHVAGLLDTPAESAFPRNAAAG
jgi:L-2-hydroxyglutarate oxidase LhgO